MPKEPPFNHFRKSCHSPSNINEKEKRLHVPSAPCRKTTVGRRSWTWEAHYQGVLVGPGCSRVTLFLKAPICMEDGMAAFTGGTKLARFSKRSHSVPACRGVEPTAQIHESSPFTEHPNSPVLCSRLDILPTMR